MQAYEFFKPTRGKIIADVIFSTVLLVLTIAVLPETKQLFFVKNTLERIGYVSLNFALFLVFFYPIACSCFFIYNHYVKRG